MALFLKQDFSPPLFSRRWIATKFRPNVLLYSRDHIISILESGLLFREDSVEVETEAPSPEDVWKMAGGGSTGWLTTGERVLSLSAVCGCLVSYPPRSVSRTSAALVLSYLTLPLLVRSAHRALCRSTYLCALLAVMRDYLALARRAAACVKEYSVMYKELESIAAITECCYSLLVRQQTELSLLMSRASSALLGNVPWLRGDVAWEAVGKADTETNLMKIHHAFLVVQSTLLKHVAMAHFRPSPQAHKIYKNHNERINWIHSVLLKELYDEYKQNYEVLERNYRLLRNYSNVRDEPRKPGSAIVDNWMYSEVHTGVARANIELKMAVNKCNSLDILLDACALNKQSIDIDILNKDLDDLVESITKCLKTAQNSQFKLQKLKNKLGRTQHKMADTVKQDGGEKGDDVKIVSLNAPEAERKDEVYYYCKVEEDDVLEPAKDEYTMPGKKEKETTKIVLNELRRKLVKREDLMRERERQALVNTMPEYKDKVPEFPRQINLAENCEKRGFIQKLNHRLKRTKKLFKTYKIQSKTRIKPFKNVKLKRFSEPNSTSLEANVDLRNKSKKSLKIIMNEDKNILINDRVYTKADQDVLKKLQYLDSSCISDLSDGDCGLTKPKGEAKNYEMKFSRADLELTTSSDTDLELDRLEILKDIRRNRVARKKNFPPKARSMSLEEQDEGSKPMEYSFGAGLALASCFQGKRNGLLGAEEVFIGNGEVSEDSGNDEDA